jgi:hypothetical protein
MNSINHIWGVLCQSSIIDNSTNNLTIFNTLEEIQVEVKPKPGEKIEPGKLIHLPMNFEIISLWQRTNVEKKVICDSQIEIYDSKNKLIQTFTQPFNLDEGKKRFRTILQISGFAVSESGDYSFHIKIREPNQTSFKTVSIIPLEVKIKIEK